MTDTEMTAEYIAEYGFGSDCNNITSYEVNKEIEQAFLAGLKAGRPKWHKVADGDLPKRLKAVWVKTEYDDYCEGYWWPEINKWQDSDMDDSDSIGDVVAWCEIPKFEEVDNA